MRHSLCRINSDSPDHKFDLEILQIMFLKLNLKYNRCMFKSKHVN